MDVRDTARDVVQHQRELEGAPSSTGEEGSGSAHDEPTDVDMDGWDTARGMVQYEQELEGSHGC